MKTYLIINILTNTQIAQVIAFSAFQALQVYGLNLKLIKAVEK